MRTILRRTLGELGEVDRRAIMLPDAPSAADWDLLLRLRELWHRRYVILAVTMTVGISSAVYYLLLPNRYTATATLLPPQTNSELSSLVSLLPEIVVNSSGARGHAEVGLYQAMLQSRTVIEPLLSIPFPTRERQGQTVLLSELLGTSDPERACQRMKRKVMTTSIDPKLGICRLSVCLTDPVTAAAVCNALISSLADCGVGLKTVDAEHLRQFLAQRLTEVRDELNQAENRLEAFRLKNMNFSRTGAPDLQLEDERLSREVTLKSSLYLRLSEQYEMARIEEKRDIGSVRILESAHIPTVKSGPHRIRGIILATSGAGVLAASLLFFWGILYEMLPRGQRESELSDPTEGENV